MASQRLARTHREIEVLAKLPRLVSALALAGDLHPSQQRALEMFWTADNARPETLRAIGHASLAAITPDVRTLPRSLDLVLRKRRWPSEALQITAADAYSGERLVISESAGVPVHRAAAASSSVPGLFAPQPILDRRCMDGGVSGSGTHPDLAAGALRALVLAVRDTADVAVATSEPGKFNRDVELLRASGTQVEVRTSRLPDMQLMDPTGVSLALELGAQQADEDATALATFFNEPQGRPTAG